MAYGVLVIDKPPNLTSHDVVVRVRHALGTQRIGHLGTLDPLATGVLPLVVGRATRLARYLPASPKEYIGEIRLGIETTTGDADGDVVEDRSVDVSRENVSGAMRLLTGRLEQVPPAFSAKKIDGVAAYKLARRGIDPSLRPVAVEVEAFEMTTFESPALGFRVVCSTGTYVRSLARDLGRALGTGAHLRVLRRTRAGVFTLADAHALNAVTPADLDCPERFFGEVASLTIDEESEQRVRHGDRIACSQDSATLCILNKRGKLIAIGAAENGWARPKVVLI